MRNQQKREGVRKGQNQESTVTRSQERRVFRGERGELCKCYCMVKEHDTSEESVGFGQKLFIILRSSFSRVVGTESRLEQMAM